MNWAQKMAVQLAMPISRFDLSQIPVGSAITSANLEIYCWNTHPDGDSQNAEIAYVLGDWQENKVTWNNKPGIGAIVDNIPIQDGRKDPGNKQYHHWNALELVQAARLAGENSVDIAIYHQNSSVGHKVKYHSREAGSNKPMLRLQFTDDDNTAPVISAVTTSEAITDKTGVILGVTATDVDEDPLSYAWTMLSGPERASPQFTASDKDPAVEFDAAGNYEFAVSVNDGRGGIDTGTVSVQVTVRPSSISIKP